MKYSILAGIILLLVLISCEEPKESIVGSSGDTEIRNISFQVDTLYIDSEAVAAVARGKVRNVGSTTISAPWYIEAQFYTDSTYRTKMGGNYTQIRAPLSSGQETFWTISFSSNNVDVREYPNFRVKDLRAIYKK